MVYQEKNKWQLAWQGPVFKKTFIAGALLLIMVLSALPFFFQVIQKRNGQVLNDWFLASLPAADLSVYIFCIIWGVTVLSLVRTIKDPALCLQIIWTYLIVCVSRIISIWLVPLEPPPHLIELADPLSNIFYGKSFVTKDLFYSGHTSTIFMLFLCLKKMPDKIIAFIGSVCVGVMLLIQHVHYSVDVILAPVFTYFCFKIAQQIIRKALHQNASAS